MFVAAAPFLATKPPLRIYLHALLLKLIRRRASAGWTISNQLEFLKRPIRSLIPPSFRHYGSQALDSCSTFYRAYRWVKTECTNVMESLVYENSPLADYLQGELLLDCNMFFGILEADIEMVI